MADFSEAFDGAMSHEGSYVDDPDDAGGETYRGISRRYNPAWTGWKEIGKLRRSRGFPQCLDDNKTLRESVKTYYRQTCWDSIRGDELPDQEIAAEVFDTSVNLGVVRAVTFLQTALNVLNRNGELYADLVEDGRLGPKTLAALLIYLSDDKPHYLLTVMNVLQGMHYIELMRRSPQQEKYARGWLARVSLIKS